MSPRCVSRVKYSVRLSRDRATLSKSSGATDRSSCVAFETASTMKSLPRCVNSARRLSFSQVHDSPIRVNRVNCPDANEYVNTPPVDPLAEQSLPIRRPPIVERRGHRAQRPARSVAVFEPSMVSRVRIRTSCRRPTPPPRYTMREPSGDQMAFDTNAVRREGQLPKVAAVRPDRPDLVLAAAIRKQGDLPSIGRPRGVPVVRWIVGQLALATAIGTADQKIHLITDAVVGQPLSIRRRRHPRKESCSANHCDRRCGDRSGNRIEWNRLDGRGSFEGGVRDATSVGGNAQVSGEGRWRRERLRLRQNSSRLFIDRDPPHVHAAAAVAREIQMAAVGRPHRIPVECGVRRDRDRCAALRRDCVDIALPESAFF